MKDFLSPTNEVELTASLPQGAQTQEHKPTPIEQMQDSDLERQIIAVITASTKLTHLI